MQLKDQNILYFTRTMGLGGTEKVVLQLCDFMSEKVNNIVVCAIDGVNTQKLSEMGIKFYQIPDIEKKDIFTVLKTMKVLIDIINKENITIVHTQHRMAAFYIKIIGKVKNILFFHTMHNTFSDKYKLTRFALNKAKIIAVGDKVKENLCNYYNLSNKQVYVIRNAIPRMVEPIESIPMLTKLKENSNFLIGNIGRLSEQKGMKYFIEAIPFVLQKCKNIKFIIVGEGEQREYLEQLIQSLNISNDVIMMGYRNDIQNVMSQLDFIVLSSLWEGLPLTPLEAFSVGKPIVATQVDGTVEIVKDNFNGKLVKSQNVEELANAIIELTTNTDLLNKYSENAKITYEANSYEKMKNSYIEFYEREVKY